MDDEDVLFLEADIENGILGQVSSKKKNTVRDFVSEVHVAQADISSCKCDGNDELTSDEETNYENLVFTQPDEIPFAHEVVVEKTVTERISSNSSAVMLEARDPRIYINKKIFLNGNVNGD